MHEVSGFVNKSTETQIDRHHGGNGHFHREAPPQTWPGEFHIFSNIKIVESLLVLAKAIDSYKMEDAHETLFQSEDNNDAWWGGLSDLQGFPGDANTVVTP